MRKLKRENVTLPITDASKEASDVTDMVKDYDEIPDSALIQSVYFSVAEAVEVEYMLPPERKRYTKITELE